jgi:hypothetical protein
VCTGLQITESELLGVSALLLCGAPAELLVVAGALDAGPLAVSDVDGAVVVVVDDEVLGSGEPESLGFGEVDVDGDVDGFVEDDGGFVGVVLDGDGGGELDEPPPEPCVPLGSSVGPAVPVAVGVGVGSSDVP